MKLTKLNAFWYLAMFVHIYFDITARPINSLLRFSERHHSPVSFTFTLQSFWLIDNQTQRVEQFSRKKTPKTFQNQYQLTIWTILTNFAVKSIKTDDGT